MEALQLVLLIKFLDMLMNFHRQIKVGVLQEKEELEEKIQPFMISYSKYGKHAGFEDAKSLQDLQNKAQKLTIKTIINL